jgi:hypothetical protein
LKHGLVIIILGFIFSTLLIAAEVDFSDDIELLEKKKIEKKKEAKKPTQKTNEKNKVETKEGLATSNGIDFGDEINQLDTVPVDDYRAGSWGTDIQAWKEGKATLSNQKRRRDLSKLSKKCKPFWDNPDPKNTCNYKTRFELVLYSECSWSGACAKKYGPKCRRKGFKEGKAGFSSCISEMKKKSYRDYLKRKAIEKAEDEEYERQKNRQCRVERDYCTEVKEDVDKGQLPVKKYPAWTPKDEKAFKSSVAFLDLELEKQLLAAKQEMLEQEIQEMKDIARKNAALERLAQMKIKGQQIRDNHEKSCLIHIAKGGDHCSCGEFLPSPRKTCGK